MFDIFALIRYIAGILSLSSTALLLFLILRHSSKEMSVYRWLIFYLSATDALTSVVILIADFQPIFLSYYVIGGLQ
jgi:hypothetical protein